MWTSEWFLVSKTHIWLFLNNKRSQTHECNLLQNPTSSNDRLAASKTPRARRPGIEPQSTTWTEWTYQKLLVFLGWIDIDNIEFYRFGYYERLTLLHDAIEQTPLRRPKMLDTFHHIFHEGKIFFSAWQLEGRQEHEQLFLTMELLARHPSRVRFGLSWHELSLTWGLVTWR